MNQSVATPQSKSISERKGMPTAGSKYSPFPVPQLDDRTAVQAYRKGTDLVFGRSA